MDDFWDLFHKHRDDKGDSPVIACTGHQLHPEELLGAMGIDSVNLLVGGNEYWQTRGMEYLTPTSCVYSRHAIGFFEEKRDDASFPIKHVLHTNFCSGDYHSVEVLHHFFGIETIPFTLPYKVTPGAFKLVVNTVRRVAARLSTITGEPLDDERLRASLVMANRLKQLYRSYSSLPVHGHDRLRDFYEVALAPWDRREAVLTRIIDQRREEVRSGRWHDDGMIVVVTGSPILVGDTMSQVISDSGLVPRFFDFHFADQAGFKMIPAHPGEIPRLGTLVDFSDPVHVLAAYYLEVLAPERMVSGNVGNTHLDKRLEQVARYNTLLDEGKRVRGVIHHVLKFCDVFGTDRTMFKERAQSRLGISVLDIERDFSSSSVGQLATRLEAFKEVLDQQA